MAVIIMIINPRARMRSEGLSVFPLKGERGALPPPFHQANNYKGQSTDQVNIAQNQS